MYELECIDPNRPHALELIGQKLVLFRDAEGKWSCLQDACPHRLAPLSEGRIDGGQLECSYHGWRFSGDGRCTRIPQSLDAKAEATACASGRSCAKSYPVREAAGLLWVWADASPGADEEAASTPLPIPRALQEHADAGRRTRWYRRQLPYSWDVLIENVTDPAHLPHSHHRLTPMLTRDQAGPMPFIPALQQQQQHEGASSAAPASESGTGPKYSFPHAPPVGAFRFPSALSKSGIVAFDPPCCVIYEYELPSKTKFYTLIYCTPMGPGRSIVHTMSLNAQDVITWGHVIKAAAKNIKGAVPMIFRRLAQSMPTWRVHMISNKLFDQDNVFLHQQDLFLQQRGRGSWASDYYMPVQCDSLVIAARRWIDTQGGGGPPYAPGADPLLPLPKRALQDRWAQHTRHCTACQEGAKQLERRARSGKAAAAALFVALCALLGTYGVPGLLAGGLPGIAAAAAALGAAVALVAARKAEVYVQQFHYVGFNHADNN